MIEDVLERTTDKWTRNDDKMQENIQILLQLQRERLEMEKERLAFKRELAGIPEKKNVNSQRKVVMVVQLFFDTECHVW